MKLLSIHPGGTERFLKRYTLTYENKAGKEKKYEMVSRNTITQKEDLGSVMSGFSIIATTSDDRMILLKEFRMAINRPVYNLIAGMIEDGETPEECVKREVFEETGLKVDSIDLILPPSYSAVAISDIMTQIAYVTVSGEISNDNMSANEEIKAAFYTKEQIRQMLQTEKFSSRSQLAAYQFAYH